MNTLTVFNERSIKLMSHIYLSYCIRMGVLWPSSVPFMADRGSGFFLINFIEKIKLSKFPINIVFAVKFKFIGKNVQKSRNYSS
jgi:hypothetical protein